MLRHEVVMFFASGTLFVTVLHFRLQLIWTFEHSLIFFGLSACHQIGSCAALKQVKVCEKQQKSRCSYQKLEF